MNPDVVENEEIKDNVTLNQKELQGIFLFIDDREEGEETVIMGISNSCLPAGTRTKVIAPA